MILKRKQFKNHCPLLKQNFKTEQKGFDSNAALFVHKAAVQLVCVAWMVWSKNRKYRHICYILESGGVVSFMLYQRLVYLHTHIQQHTSIACAFEWGKQLPYNPSYIAIAYDYLKLSLMWNVKVYRLCVCLPNLKRHNNDRKRKVMPFAIFA